MKQIQDPITTEKDMEQDMCKCVWKIEGRKDNRIEDFERILECFINGGFLNNHQIQLIQWGVYLIIAYTYMLYKCIHTPTMVLTSESWSQNVIYTQTKPQSI